MIHKNWVKLLFTVWFVAISFRFAKTAVQGLRSPFNFGNDIEWFLVWIAIAIIMIIVAASVKRSVQIVFSVVALLCILVLILSGTLLAAAAASGILLTAYITGRAFLSFFGTAADDLALTIPLGLIFPALGGFVLAALHLLTPIAIYALLISLVAVSYFLMKGRNAKYRDRSVSPTRSISLPLVLAAPVIFLNFAWAVAPEIQYDANNYHLAVSRIYLQEHRLVELQYFFHSYFYRLIEMLFTVALAIHSPAAAKLLNFSFGLIAAAAVFSLGKHFADENTGAWAAAFFYTTPIVSWLSGTSYIDNAAAMFLCATMIVFLKWLSNEGQVAYLYATALLAGATIASKINAAFGLVVIALGMLWHLRGRPKYLAACLLIMFIVALPWFVPTYLWTGNPVFPMLNGVFKSPTWTLENRVMDARDYGIELSFVGLLKLPFWLTWDTTRFSRGSPRGAAGMMLLLVLPFSLALVIARKRYSAILFATTIIFFVLWAFSFQNIRYYVPMLPIICVLGVATVLHFSRAGRLGMLNRICMACVLVLQFSPAPLQFWNIEDRFPMGVALGIESSEAFLTRSIPTYAAVERLNAVVKPPERVVGVDVENVRFYLDAPLETLSDSTLNNVLRDASDLSGESLHRLLRHSAFAYIFATRESLRNPPVWYPYIHREFLDQFATSVYSDANAVVYRLNP